MNRLKPDSLYGLGTAACIQVAIASQNETKQKRSSKTGVGTYKSDILYQLSNQ
jgi:hypothetical protein